MTRNIDMFEARRNGDVILLRFTDIFGEGEEYSFDVEDAKGIRDGIDQMIKKGCCGGRHKPGSSC